MKPVVEVALVEGLGIERARGGTGDAERASDLLRQALATARALELIGLEQRAVAALQGCS